MGGYGKPGGASGARPIGGFKFKGPSDMTDSTGITVFLKGPNKVAKYTSSTNPALGSHEAEDTGLSYTNVTAIKIAKGDHTPQAMMHMSTTAGDFLCELKSGDTQWPAAKNSGSFKPYAKKTSSGYDWTMTHHA